MKTGSAFQSIPDVELLFDEPLARHTTFRVGGPVRVLARPRSEESLAALLKRISDAGIPSVVLGGGSNVLPPDEPWEAAVIQLSKACGKLSCLEENAYAETLVYAGAGRKLQDLVRFCIREGLQGLESLAGIPGTVGGALVMNAGTPSGTISDSLWRVHLMDAGAERRQVPRDELNPGYRTMGLPEGSIVLGGSFKLGRASSEDLKARAGHILQHRKRTQPLRYPSAGSVFKNPPGQFAGALIEKAGLKGCRIGEAEVSKKHANWIINRGGALARDIRELIEKIENEIYGTFGVRLEREIRILQQL